MNADDLARYYQDYLSRQPSRFGVSPLRALAQLREVMQWPQEAAAAEKKSGRESPAGTREQEKRGGPRLRAG
ncbi:hypothetical protein KIF53_05425 [Chromobacterium subtsugae]|uniref:Uncharacterized protein n=1 Tax=Chromobacterium subtsugae TaxID=251747 RepID=A0ABS7FAF1_9NEIS|nr:MULTISPECIES: hypothetical protein [Chromobacterium]KUM05670.1 hypothetical protein Cv017_07915 [Chromobacterium subtsugae]KZE87163.1 hypothetical protein AWB61_12500 [Chromobacterium sp. F49]MBW7565893.1 hypothetical protein [Chromobacterium subtsugae]MBW8287067.1 hypothetical protein [Chromobacterium subtsugae]OBU88166.1 hypothetical protein MY55_01125 [Chromobacterium subtsugae]